MYLPRHFADHEPALLDRLLEDHPFVTLVTVDPGGTPFASQLPVLHARQADSLLIEGHWARANPQWRHEGEVLMLVHGPHAYVSPGAYPDKHEAARVPTWNYVSAQLRGRLEVFDDTEALGDLVQRLSARMEQRNRSAWSFDPRVPSFARQLPGIVGFRFRPTQVSVKAKLSQNHTPVNAAAVAASLERRARPGDAEVAALMRERLAQRT